MVLTLYKLDGSPPARAVMMTIEALGIPDVEFIDVNLLTAEHMTEEFLKINPQHTIPMLKDDDFIIWDSHAINAYLVNKYGENDALYPTDFKKRAQIDQRLHFDSGILFPALRGTLEPVVFGDEKSFRPESLNKIRAAYDFTEKFLTSPYLLGDDVTLADICCVATISSMNLLVPIDDNTYPNVSAWIQRCASKEFYKKANEPGLEQLTQLIKTKCE
uniref:Glutathione S-transferase epsilon 3 n=1 Tax=Cnaphalocrocis medinalis TaxID=437488 RepID=A0A077DB43_CNAME|nr:glutathione S-transferase epsilon 3 [Cnaphalocrocis medinalis]